MVDRAIVRLWLCEVCPDRAVPATAPGPVSAIHRVLNIDSRINFHGVLRLNV